MSGPCFVDGIGSLAERFGGFILDQWGVLHDGSSPLPGVLQTLERLRSAGKSIALLSNSARRVDANIQRLRKMGFDIGLFAGIVTSGEVTWRSIRDRHGEPWSRLGRRCLFTTIGGDAGPVEGLGLDLVNDPTDADFLLITGLDGREAASFLPMLEQAAARQLPMVCANPDKWAPMAGGLSPSPGLLAAMYAGLGGTVHFVGKPHARVYAECLKALGGLPAERIIAIGDSLEHDIAGAKHAGLTACMVLEGIHAADFPPSATRTAEVARLAALIEEHRAVPDYVIRRFTW